MTIAVISDIHGNKQAFEAVLEDIAKFDIDHIVCLGDIVGYGGDPDWCVQTVKAVASISILGNHDVVVAEIQRIGGMNPVAVTALVWTMDNVSENSLKFIRGLSYLAQEPGGKIGYVHGSLPHPQGFGYLLQYEYIEEHLKSQSSRIMFVGHSHQPDYWSTDGKKIFSAMTFRNGSVRFNIGNGIDKSVVNVGSVGQPRDHDPRASYVLVETDGSDLKITNRRVEYDVESAQGRIRECGLPEGLAVRLEFGK
jgi:predicted phosphodiesterase